MKKNRKFIIFFLLLSLFFVLFNFGLLTESLAQRELETDYPEIFGFKPETVETLLPDYVRYLFNFFIAMAGVVAFGVLLWAGYQYLTSAGKPEQIKKARQQIKAAILGLALLLLSYIILTTINPQLIALRQPEVTPLPDTDVTIPISPLPTADLLGRIRALAQAVIEAADQMANVSRQIKSLTDQCNCTRTQPLCIVRGYRTGACQAEYCYSAAPDQPCPQNQQIKLNQQKLFDLRDVLLYYKNRALAEDQDLKEDLEKIVNEQLRWYEQTLAAERRVLEQCQNENCEREQQNLIEALEQDKAKKEIEQSYKQALRVKLVELANAIERLRTPATELATLPDRCLTDVKEKCQGSCTGGGHDTPGCFPSGCSGDNPCPTEDIQSQLDNISSILLEIKQIAQEIIRIVNSIPNPDEAPPPVPPACETLEGVCLEQGEPPPPGYQPYNQYPCPDEKQCWLPEQQVICNCSNAPYEGCANLTDYGIPIKPGAGTMTDPRMAEKLVVFNNCLLRNNVLGWRITEACPPQIQHQSACHHISGTCVDANSAVLCRNRAATRSCITEAGFSRYIDECNTGSPHFHIIF